MSELILKGDIVENFGKYLPVPYINKIYISTVDSNIWVDVVFNVFILAPVEVDEETLIERLGGYTFKWFTPLDSVPITDQIKDGNEHLQDLFELYGSITIGHRDFTLSDFITTADGTEAYEVLYDENGNRILKFTYDSRVNDGGITLDSSEFNSSKVYQLLAWSTTEDLAEAHWLASSDADYSDTWGKFLNSETSDVAYEIIAENGTIYSGNETIWVDTNDGQYGGTPLQSITSLYYQPDRITHAEIVESFQSLIDDYTMVAETDSDLQDVLNNISYILETFGTAVDLLPQLNEFRKAFPSKTSATTVGQLYAKYRKKGFTANEVAVLGTELFKKIVSSPKVVDMREVEIESYVPPEYPNDFFPGSYALTAADDCVGVTGESCEEGTCDFVYLGEFGTFWAGTMGGMQMTRVAYPGGGYYAGTTWDDASIPGVNHDAFGANYGMFFFDYDKALYYKSYISKFMDIKRLITLFGVEVFNASFSLAQVTLRRYRGDAIRMELVQDFTQTTYPQQQNTSHFIYPEDGDAEGEEAGIALRVAIGSTDINNTTNLTLRNFDFASYTKIDGYGIGYVGQPSMRFMAFEFQDIMGYNEQLTVSYDDADLNNRQKYRVEVTMDDNTHQILEAVVNVYEQFSTDNLEGYVDAANEACSSNMTTGFFNQYFIDEQMALYGDDMNEAPWIKGPTLYTYFQDLFYNSYGGDTELMTNTALALSYTISPSTGTVAGINAFFINYEALVSSWSSENIDYETTNGVITITNLNTPITFSCEYDLDKISILHILDSCTEAGGDAEDACPGHELMNGWAWTADADQGKGLELSSTPTLST